MIVLVGNANVAGLRADVRADLQAMASEFKRATGGSLKVTSGFRSMAQQAALYAADPSKAARPGWSMHQYGYAVDVDSTQAGELARRGLLAKYRFARPLAKEPWHIERAGLVYGVVRAGAVVGALLLAVVAVRFFTK